MLYVLKNKIWYYIICDLYKYLWLWRGFVFLLICGESIKLILIYIYDILWNILKVNDNYIKVFNLECRKMLMIIIKIYLDFCVL